MTIKRIGLVGVGLMGHGIGKNIVTKGYALSVCVNRNRAPVDSLVALGAVERSSPAEVAAHSDLVILCVTGSPEVEQAVMGENGVLKGAKPGLIIADCSTAEPGSTLKLASLLSKHDVTLIDTPLTRTPKEAEAGKLGLMVGADDATLAAVRPVLECFADTIVHCGPVGAGHQMKLINNFLSLSHAAIAAEAIAVAAKAGVSMQALKDIVVAGGANSVMFERLIKIPLENDDTAAKFTIQNARKDLGYYASMAADLPVPALMAAQVLQLFTIAVAQGYGERFVPRMVDMMMELGGVEAKSV